MSVASDGTQAIGQSISSSISGDGRYVVFDSHGSNLVPEDTDAEPDIFLHDRQSGTTQRVSVSADSSQAMTSVDPPRLAPTAATWPSIRMPRISCRTTQMDRQTSLFTIDRITRRGE